MAKKEKKQQPIPAAFGECEIQGFCRGTLAERYQTAKYSGSPRLASFQADIIRQMIDSISLSIANDYDNIDDEDEDDAIGFLADYEDDEDEEAEWEKEVRLSCLEEKRQRGVVVGYADRPIRYQVERNNPPSYRIFIYIENAQFYYDLNIKEFEENYEYDEDTLASWISGWFLRTQTREMRNELARFIKQKIE